MKRNYPKGMISSSVMPQTTKENEGVEFSSYIFIAPAYIITLYPQTNWVNNSLSCSVPTVWT